MGKRGRPPPEWMFDELPKVLSHCAKEFLTLSELESQIARSRTTLRQAIPKYLAEPIKVAKAGVSCELAWRCVDLRRGLERLFRNFPNRVLR